MINGIGLIRFFLALLVALFHFFHFTDLKIFEKLAVGFFGVSLFFVLSGFLVINMVIRNRYHLKPSGFVLNRTMRIYPTYFFTLMFAMVVVPDAGNHLAVQITRYDHLLESSKWGSIGQSFLFAADWWSFFWSYVSLIFRNTNVYYEGDWNPVLWTIDVELRAYLVCVAVLYFMRTKLGRMERERILASGSVGLARLVIICLGLALLLDLISVLASPASMGILVISHDNSMRDMLQVVFAPFMDAVGILYFLPFFLVGAMLALKRIFWPANASRLLAVLFIWVNILYWNYLRIQTSVPTELFLFNTLLFAFSLTFIIWIINKRSFFPMWLRKIDSIAGDFSYPLYLLNFPVILWLNHKVDASPSNILVVFGYVFIVTLACTVLVDRPLRYLRVRITETRLPNADVKY